MQFIECCPAREKQHGMDTGWFHVCLLFPFVITWLTAVAATAQHHRRGCITHLQIRKRSKFKIQSTVSTKGILLLHPCKAEKWWAEPGWVGVCLCVTKCQSRGRPTRSSGEAGWGATGGPELDWGDRLSSQLEGHSLQARRTVLAKAEARQHRAFMR